LSRAQPQGILGATATVVPAGIVRLTEFEEQGWSYIHP
jgi:intracellular sulfur oxidation DsrE/DsrF family protein